MRSAAEIRFRLRREAGNLLDLLFSHGKGWADPDRFPNRLPDLPAPEAVASALVATPFAVEAAELAAGIRAHRIPLFDRIVELGPAIDWRRDYESGITTGTAYFRRIPYLDRDKAGDHKNVWELNRHQHLVLLAQDALLHDNRDSMATIEKHLAGWRAANPYLRGINWRSALEVAFRALSWIWVWQLAAERLSVAARRELLLGLEEHGRYLERNISVYFSPNTHLLGEALALHALGVLLPGLPGADHWRTVGRRVVREEMAHQVRADGGHFEQSAYYHVYALDMFLLHALLEEPPADYLDGLRRMGIFLAALLGDTGRIPLLGDDDGGRLFHPYGRRDEFGRASLAALGCYLRRGGESVPWSWGEPDLWPMASWWLGETQAVSGPGSEPRPALFPDTGLARLTANGCDCWFDCGPFGPGGAGHSHADALQVVVRFGGEEILIDPATYTYVGDARERDRFRGTAMHNTVRIGGLDQATPAGPFRWQDKPGVQQLAFAGGEWGARASAECRYRGYRHRREVGLAACGGGAVLAVVDTITGERSGADVVLLEQFWHTPLQPVTAGENIWRLGEATVRLGGETSVEQGGEFGWRSLAPGQRGPAPVLCARYRQALPAVLTAIFVLGSASIEDWTLERLGEGWILVGPGGKWGTGATPGTKEGA